MRTAVLVVAVALATAGLAASPAAAATVCGQDGAASLCADAAASADALAIHFQVTQTDGPGTYLVYYVDTVSGLPGPANPVGPLGYQAVAAGTLYAHLNHCYDVHLDSAPGTSLVVGSVCG
jgi:hypothetical protein